ncbi:MAG: hypothetical protein Udaeo_06380 [Candidatus Udaeobacter sp.]|nr:MAG: hypothetical protein Udaeo_06380 [Candidatus Udaeobacter sp.]
MRIAAGGIEALGGTKQQHIAQKIEDRFVHCRVAAFGCGDGTLDDLLILFRYRLTGLDVGSVNRKARNCFPYGTRQRFERKIAIPSVSLGQTIEQVS